MTDALQEAVLDAAAQVLRNRRDEGEITDPDMMELGRAFDALGAADVAALSRPDVWQSFNHVHERMALLNKRLTELEKSSKDSLAKAHVATKQARELVEQHG